MNFDWTSFLIGLIAGWLLEWIIDWVYWRRGRVSAEDLAALQEQLDAAQTRADEAQATAAGAQTELAALRSDYDDLREETADLESIRAELATTQTNYVELQQEYVKLSAENAELQNLADAARIAAIGRLTAIDGVDEEHAGRLVEAGITGRDDLTDADDETIQAALGVDDIEYARWSAAVKAGLASLGLAAAAAYADEDEELLPARYTSIDLDDEGMEEGIEFEPGLITEEVLETYDFDDDGEVDLVLETTRQGYDIDDDGEIDIVLEELVEADILDEEAVAEAEAAMEAEIDAELEALDEVGEQSPGRLAALAAAAAVASRDEAVAPDDLTQISGIGPRFSEKLNAYGIATFAALAAAGDDELDAAIEPQNWQKLDYESWRTQARTFAEVPLPQLEGDDLQLLEGIGPKYSQLLREADILTFAELADTEPERLAEIIGAPAWRKVDYDAWIAQAGLAAAGDRGALIDLQDELNVREEDNLLLIHGLGPKYAQALEDADVNTFSELAARTPEELSQIVVAAGLRNTDFQAWIDEANLRIAGKRVPRVTREYEEAVVVSCPQDLESVEGVGVVYERRLYEAGIGSYWEIAQISEQELSDILEVLPFQEVDLAAIRASAMALAIETGTVNQVWNGTEPDDFEPLEGIGVIYERRLYSAGYCTYEALAAATPEELEKVCRPPAFHKPDFAGWIATAQILAAAEGADEA